MGISAWWLALVVTVMGSNFHFKYIHRTDINTMVDVSTGQFQTVSLILCSIVSSIQNKHCFFYDRSIDWCSPYADTKNCNYQTGVVDRKANLSPSCLLQKQLNACNRDTNLPITKKEFPAKTAQSEDLQRTQQSIINLHQACAEGKLDVVKYILSQGLVDINCRGKQGQTPVMVAAKNGHLNVFEYLVCHCSNLSVEDDVHSTVLHEACRGGNVNIVRKLIVDNKCDIESKDAKGRRPIMWAAKHGWKKIFDLLEENRSNLTVVNHRNDTILHIACAGDRVDFVQYILSLKIFTIESRGYCGRTPVMTAAASGCIPVFNFLVEEGCDTKAVSILNNSILHIACAHGHVPMVKHILSRNIINKESRGALGKTPLLTAAARGEKKVFVFLVENGCNLSAVDNADHNILHLSSRFGHLDIVKYILSHNLSSIESRGRIGRTPVMEAVIGGNIEVFSLLHSKGCKLRGVDNLKNTILHVACQQNNVTMVKYLMSLEVVDGMENMKNRNGQTPVDIAEQRGHVAVVKLLKGNN